MLYLFYPISQCWLNLNWLNLKSQFCVLNIFYSSAIRYVFSFHKLPNIHFFILSEHFLQISHNLRMINSQKNMSAEAQ